ncbi:TolC family protein [Salinibius halmophilus]|uniref:TolC family protein n=1 Tax=Salinibius halmophilus TaxID=1853216 RepID=UPI000E66181A|nr:TolC family protein [Salinibius halmophilus]
MRSIVTLLVFSISVTTASVQAASITELWQHLATPEQQAAQAALAQAQAKANQASHAWVPNLSINGKSTWLTEPLTTTTEVPPLAPGMQPMSLEQELRPEQFNQARLQADWLLYGGGQVRHTAKAAEHALAAHQAQSESVRLAQLPTLVTRYRSVQLANQQVAIRQQAVGRLTGHLDRARKMQQQGQLADIDVLKVRTELAMANQLLLQAKNDQALANQALTSLLEKPVSVTLTMPIPSSVVIDDSQVLTTNADLQALAAKEAASQSQALVSRASLLPKVFVFAQHELIADELAASEPETAVGIGWQWQLVDRRGRLQQLQQAQSAVEEIRYQRQAAVRDVQLAINQQQNRLQNALEQVSAIEQRLALARQQRRLADQSFAAGLATVQDITDAELNYAAIELEQQQAVLQAHIALAELAKLAGDEQVYFSAI